MSPLNRTQSIDGKSGSRGRCTEQFEDELGDSGMSAREGDYVESGLLPMRPF